MANNNKDKILHEAGKVISKKGYFGAGLNEILTACQIPKGSFYYYFPKGKNQLTVEVVEHAFEAMKHGIEEHIFYDCHDALTVFTRMIDHLTNHLRNDKEYFESLIITFIGIEAPYISEEVNQASMKAYYNWEKLYEEKLIDCHYSASQAKQLAPILCSLIHGTLISCWIKKNTNDFENAKNILPILLQKRDEHE